MSTSENDLPQRVLVTGAAQGLGALILQEARANGYLAQGFEWMKAPPAGTDYDQEIRFGDWFDPDFLQSGVQGIHHILHTATDRRPRATYEDLARSNIELSRRLFEAAAEAGCRTFLYLSSARICASTGRYAGEESKVEATNAYEQTLYDAEILLRGLANRLVKGPRLVVLRTAAVYGQSIPPEGAPWLAIPPILSLAFTLIPGIAGGPRTHWVHAADVARAAIHLVSLDTGKQIETYHVADDNPISMGEFINQLIEAYGYSLGVKVPFPTPVLLEGLLKVADNDLVLGYLDSLLTRLWQSVRESYSITEEYWPALSPESLSTVLKDSIISNDLIKSTGFSLQFPDVRLGIRDLIHSCQKRQILPDPRPDRLHQAVERHTYWTSFTEKLHGSYSPAGNETRKKVATIEARITSPEIRLPMRADLWDLDGVVTLEGMATEAPIEGTLELCLLSRRKLLYQFGFQGDDGQWYRFEGSKSVGLRHLLTRLTRMRFSVIDKQGRTIARGEAQWDPRRDLLEFARNFRIRKIREATER